MLRNFFSHGSNAVPVVFAILLAAAAISGALHLPVWLIALGALLFYLGEYGTHRFLFHARPARSAWLRAKQHRLHYDHHREPARLDLLFLPLWYLVPNFLLAAAIAYAVLREPGAVAALLLGVTLAVLHYEGVHFLAHRPYEPKTGIGRWMKRHHLRHHFVSEKLWFGVSNPLLDFLGRTYDAPEGSARSATTRVLYPDDQAPV